jgi:hypothetical protein
LVSAIFVRGAEVGLHRSMWLWAIEGFGSRLAQTREAARAAFKAEWARRSAYGYLCVKESGTMRPRTLLSGMRSPRHNRRQAIFPLASSKDVDFDFIRVVVIDGQHQLFALEDLQIIGKPLAGYRNQRIPWTSCDLDCHQANCCADTNRIWDALFANEFSRAMKKLPGALAAN